MKQIVKIEGLSYEWVIGSYLIYRKSRVTDAPFSIRIGSGDIGGWRGERPYELLALSSSSQVPYELLALVNWSPLCRRNFTCKFQNSCKDFFLGSSHPQSIFFYIKVFLNHELIRFTDFKLFGKNWGKRVFNYFHLCIRVFLAHRPVAISLVPKKLIMLGQYFCWNHILDLNYSVLGCSWARVTYSYKFQASNTIRLFSHFWAI